MPRGRANRSLSPGFTLVEVLLALALTTLVGASVVMMMAAVGAGVDSRNDLRRAAVARQTAILRLGSLARASGRILAANSDHLVLWTSDGNRNGAPELSELRRIHWDADAGAISAYEAPNGLDAASDATYELSADFGAITATLVGSPIFPGQVVIQNVTGWELQLDAAPVQSAHLLRWRVSIESESGTDVAVVVAAVRANAG